MNAESLLALFGTMVLLSVVPGPVDFALMARAMTAGLRQAFLMIVGIVAGDAVLIAVAVGSLTVLSEALGTAAWVLQAASGLLLAAFGLLTLRSARRRSGLPRAASAASSFLGGFLLTLGDPKALVFYLGLFPAFVDLATLGWSGAVLVLLLATVAILLVKAGYALLASRARSLFARRAVARLLEVLAGAVLLVVGLWMLARVAFA